MKDLAFLTFQKVTQLSSQAVLFYILSNMRKQSQKKDSPN